MTVSTATCRRMFEAINAQHLEREQAIYEQHYVQYCSLLGAYVSAIRDDVITRDRNPLMFDIASFEIGQFIRKQKNDAEKRRDFQILADIIHKSIGDKLNVF
ncbi:hypothetical protein L5515_012582 [Caenorhabditis briggsae]|nr:hypothetical protein L5515_012582 [Caenorhabditis briggsae]